MKLKYWKTIMKVMESDQEFCEGLKTYLIEYDDDKNMD